MDEKKYERKRMYLQYLAHINHFPLIEEMAVYFSLTVEELLMDFIMLDLVVYYLKFYKRMSMLLRRMSFYMPYITKKECVCTRKDLSNYTGIDYSTVCNDCMEMTRRFGYKFKTAGVLKEENILSKLGVRINNKGDIVNLSTGELLRKHINYSEIPLEVLNAFYQFGNILRENIDGIFEGIQEIEKISNSDFDIEIIKDREIEDMKILKDKEIEDITTLKDLEIEDLRVSKDKEIELLSKVKDETIDTLNGLLLEAKATAEKLQEEKEEVERKLRAEQYDNLVIKFGYLPSINEICSLCNFSPSLVREDMKILGLSPSTPYDDERRLMEDRIKKSALDNREYFLHNYFDADEPISISDIAKELKLCESTVVNMIGYLENEAGLEIKNKMHENVIKFSNQFDNNRNSKKPKEKVKIKVVVEEPIIEEVKVLKDENGKPLRGSEQRRKYYENNFFNTTADNFKCSELMSKELGISPATLYNDIRYLCNKYDYELPEWYQSYKPVRPIIVDGIEYENRYEFIDLHYFSSFRPLTLSELAEKMGLTEIQVFNTLNTMKQIGYSRIKGPAEDGYYKSTSYKVRKKNYDLFFKKNPSVKNLSDLSKVLCIPLNTIRDDFTLRNLYSLYTVDSEKESNPQEQKQYLERLEKYRAYFSENKSVKSLTELADNLKMRLVTVRGDFNRFNLYSEFEVDKKDSLFNEV